MHQVLYISYDGILEPLGESQVVTYLDRLAAHNGITLLSFEKPRDLANRDRVTSMEKRLAEHGIRWVRLRYHKWPPVASTVFDIVFGIVYARLACRRHGVVILHARGYVPALIALAARGVSGARFLFDMRGFWVDEKVEAGHWPPGGTLFRVGKWWERRFLRSADAIVSLTASGVRTLSELGSAPQGIIPIVVIPTCADLDRFTPTPKDPALVSALGLKDAHVFGCVGTMSGWYLRDEMLRYLAQVLRSFTRARILIVTHEDQDVLRRDFDTVGVPLDRLAITSAHFADMPRMISLFDAGVFFIRPSPSKSGSAATKLAEFLACGVPVIINDGVGDSGAIVKQHRAGVVVPTLDDETLERSLPHVRAVLANPQTGQRCRKTAEQLFDVNHGTSQYRELYEKLSKGAPRS